MAFTSSSLVYPASEDPTQQRPEHQLKTPIYLLGLAVSLLQQHFGNANRLILDKSSFVYSNDQMQSEVFITHRDNLNYEVMGKRPAIVVDFGEEQFPRHVIGDRITYIPQTGEAVILDRGVGQILVNCISDKSLESLSLATEVKYFFQTYRDVIATQYRLDNIRAASIGSYQKLKEYKDSYGRVVVIEFSAQDNFAISQESLKVGSTNYNIAPN